eukprot:TRINITY_DN4486_c0_g1_i2.p1 TRINITY_DN4486_c0_g1~~TRINITY_DN4486_c0_g1_i2.p1  ORF type:complete len:520 (+),score=158.15 TRINITY_DN4486_c0_g1_i2:50-1561(+)
MWRNAPELAVFLLFVTLGLVWWRDLVSTPPSLHMAFQLLDVPQLRVVTFLDTLSAEMRGSMDGALHSLFQELDKNGDGCIAIDEFEGMTLNAWAAFRAVGMFMPDVQGVLDRVKDTQIHSQLFSLWRTPGFLSHRIAVYVFCLLFFQFCLFVYEHAYDLLGFREPFPEPRLDQVRQCTREEALRYDTPIAGFYEKTKTAFMVLSGLALMKLLVGVLSFVIAVLCINLMVLVPNPLWFCFWKGIARFWIYFIMFSAGFYKVKIFGSPAPRSEVKMLLANHTAMMEVLVLYAAAGLPSFVSRVENLAIPLFAGVIRASDSILVDRSDRDSKDGTLKEIVRRAKDPNAPQVMIFPEGSCNNQRCLFRFNRGPFEPGEPVQLVCFRFPYRHFNPCWTGRAAGGNEIGDLLFRFACQFVNRVDVIFLPVHHPTPEEKADSTLYANNMQLLMAATLGIGISDCTYKLYHELRKEYVQRIREQKRTPPRWWPFGQRPSRRPEAEGDVKAD